MQNITSLMAAPLLWQGTIIGFLGVDNPKTENLSSELLRATVDFLIVELEKRRGSVSVNISRSMAESPGFSRDVEMMLKKYNLSPGCLTLEITEGVAKMGIDLLKSAAQNLHGIGVKVALDDFGTEYANLNVLIGTSFDEVKLDKSLIDNVCKDAKAWHVLKNVINMCRELGCIRVVAEGVEAPEQWAELEELNCSHGQGYLFYKPMTMQEYLNLLDEAAYA